MEISSFTREGTNLNKLAHDRGQKRMAIHLHMGFNRPGGASGHPDMVDTEFAWLEPGEDEEWPMQGRGHQWYSFLLFGWHNVFNLHNQCVLRRVNGNDDQVENQRIHLCAGKQLCQDWK